MDKRTISEEYTNIGNELIDNEEELEYIRESEVSIIFLSSSHAKKGKKKIVFAQCEKVADKYKWGIPCDFTITVFDPNVAKFTEEQLKVLIFHELLHIGIEFDDDGNERYFINPHDLEDFKVIVDKFGTNWCG